MDLVARRRSRSLIVTAETGTAIDDGVERSVRIDTVDEGRASASRGGIATTQRRRSYVQLDIVELPDDRSQLHITERFVGASTAAARAVLVLDLVGRQADLAVVAGVAVPRDGVTTPADATERTESGALDAMFGALADPTRRLLVERLLTKGPATATLLAEPRR